MNPSGRPDYRGFRYRRASEDVAGNAAVLQVWFNDPANIATGTLTSPVLTIGNDGGTTPGLTIARDGLTVTAGGITVTAGGITLVAGDLEIRDDVLLGLGTGKTARFSYDTTDANANALLLQLPAGGAVDVPVLAIGQSIESVDLGLFNGVVDPNLALFGVGAVATSTRLRAYKARGTVSVPTAITAGDDLFSISAYGYSGVGGYVEAARILLDSDSAGTIATTRVPGVISLQVGTDAAPTVLTERVRITSSAGITLTPVTDVIVADATGLIVGATAQETVSTGDGATDLVPEVQIQGTAQADSTLMLAQFSTTNAQAAMLAFVKGGNAAIGSHTAVGDDEYVGRIIAFGDDGTDLETPVAEIRFVVDDVGVPGTGAIGGSLEFYTTADGGSTLTLAMTIDTAQNVIIANGNGLLIGSATPLTAGAASELQVLGTALADGSAILGLFAASALAPDLQFVKGRGATIGALDIVNDNDEVGRIVWLPVDGADLATEAAVFQAEVDDASPAAGDIGMAFVWESMAGGAVAIAERMRLSAAGDLSIANGGGVIIGTATQVAAGGVTSELQIHGTGSADCAMLLASWSNDTSAPRIYFGKSRSPTIGTFTIIAEADLLGEILAYGDDGADFNSNSNPAASIRFSSAGTPIGADRIPGTITFLTATNAAPSVLTLALTISNAQLVTCAAGVTVTTGDVTISAGSLAFSAASDITIPVTTAAALEISDGTTKFYAVDTRVAVVGVTTHAFDISDYTLASAANAVATGLSLAAHTLNLTGNTQVTTQVDTVVLGARSIVGAVAITVDEANTLLLVAPTEGANVTLTATAALRILTAAGTPTNQYGVYIEALSGGTTANRGIYLAGANGIQFGVADDIIFAANTAAALELSDGTTKLLTFDTRNTVTVQNILIDAPASQTLPDAATSQWRNVSVAAHTVTLVGATQVTTVNQGATLWLGAPTYNQSGGAVTVDQVSTLHVAAPVAGASVTITANRMISTSVADCYLTGAGVWTDTVSTQKVKRDIEDLDLAVMPSLIEQIRPVTFKYDPAKLGSSDLDRQRYGVVAEELPEFLRGPGDVNPSGIASGVLSVFGLAVLRYLHEANKQLSAKVAALEASMA